MAFGPIDFIALEFKGSGFQGEIMADLTELVSMEVIRILDMVIIKKDEHGEFCVQELNELDPETEQILEPLTVEISGMITVEDIQMIGAKLRENTTTAVMLFENLWAVRLRQDISFAGGRLVMDERIPHEIVVEALQDLAMFD